MSAVKVKQDDLRRLMKEKRENLQNQKNKVDSPFAKYNNLGQLFCIICNIQIKSNALWIAHVAGKMHKENAIKKKKRPADITPSNLSKISEKNLEIRPPATKKLKIEANEPAIPKPEKTKNAAKLSLLDAYSSSEDESDPTPMKTVSSTSLNNELPKDFFDAAPSASYPINQEQQGKTTEKIPAPVNSAEALPEGFFDDPVLDAKARNIEYKDPVEEEWEKYQKAIAEETNVSKTIIEEDFEESTAERNLTEIDAQINLWEKLKTLQVLAEDARSKVTNDTKNTDSSGSTDDELEEDDLLDWRSKGVRKKR